MLLLVIFAALALLTASIDIRLPGQIQCNNLGGRCLTASSCPKSVVLGVPHFYTGICPLPEYGLVCCMTIPYVPTQPPMITRPPQSTVTNEKGCGRSSGTFRITSGVTSGFSQWPWQVSLLLNGKHICGGNLIDASTILTAAHCILSYNAREWQVRVGSNHHGLGGDLVSIMHMNGIRVHLGYNYGDVTAGSDIAIMKLARPVRYSQSIRPICLPSNSNQDFPAGTTCYVSGWGWKMGQITVESYLRHADVKLYDIQQCRAAYYPQYNVVAKDSVCAGGFSTKNSCKGDSGGPLVCHNGGHFILHGIVSWGELPCGRIGKPSIYTRVTTFLDWISANRY